jgi:hydroxypyruvate reductase
LLSDVKQDKAEFIGSGLLVASSITPEPDAYLSAFPAAEHANKSRSEKQLKPETFIIGNIYLAMQAVHEAAKAEGLNSVIHEEFLEGEAAAVADRLYTILQSAPPGIHIWGGETTVTLPGKPGVGGRNQTLALAFAQHIGEHPGLNLLAAGTDGVDGNSNCAGAVVSAYTSMKANAMGFDIKAEIEKANAGMVLMATGDLLQANHSNTNVMDIVIAYKI